MSQDYLDGLNAAARLLRDEAEKRELNATALRVERAGMAPKAYALQGSKVNTLLSQARRLEDTAELLHNLADRVQSELAP